MFRGPILTAAAACMAVLAQSPDAALTGTVTDSSNAAVPLAEVAATNTATGVVTNTRSNKSGVFVFPSLAPGAYTVRIQREGFRPLAYSDITLEIGARMRLNVLTVGEVTQPAEVSANNDTQLALESASVGGVLNGKVMLTRSKPERATIDRYGSFNSFRSIYSFFRAASIVRPSSRCSVDVRRRAG